MFCGLSIILLSMNESEKSLMKMIKFIDMAKVFNTSQISVIATILYLIV